MSDVFNHPDQKALRRRLRAEMPPAERTLWAKLRSARLGVKFRRQASIGPYVVDFYCPALRLVVEVDGPTHFNDEAEEKDSLRQKEIEAMGITFLRVTNEQVYQQLPDVLETLTNLIEKLGKQSP